MPSLRPAKVIPMRFATSVEDQRIIDDCEGKAAWKRWGNYVSARQWGTVREDYSTNGDAWNFIPHDHARSRAYRWGEDGIAGWCDAAQYLCFAPAFWNGADPILKERFFGLTNSEGNHGEDVKEYYFYIDNTPTHSYARALYKYPQRAFPYEELVRVNRERQSDPASFEYELLDTGIFNESRYFDIFIEYAKHAPDTTVIRIRAINRGPDAAPLYVLPTVWFRDIWTWQSIPLMPRISIQERRATMDVLQIQHSRLGSNFYFHAPTARELLFTENATNSQRLFGTHNGEAFCKDAFHEYLIGGRTEAVNPVLAGSKASPLYMETLAPGEERVWDFVLSNEIQPEDFNTGDVILKRREECEAFYRTVCAPQATQEEKKVQRQAFAGMLWSKQFYFIDVRRWMVGDPQWTETGRHQPRHNAATRNRKWPDLNLRAVLAVPDNWEYPWFAAWDLCFHTATFAMIDPDFAKEQLLLLTSEALLHRNGQIPAYEWEFSDANPPVIAWAAWKVYRVGQRYFGIADRDFLERMFQKLLLNFGWWVNRQDRNDSNIFEGGFLGLDNVSIFDRSEKLPGGGSLEQADGTAWMGVFALNMMRIAFELALDDPIYEDMATKFFEHFMELADSINRSCSNSTGGLTGLWDEQDEFYYDQLRYPDGRTTPLRVRSLVGLLPMIASEIIDQKDLDQLPSFKTRYDWFIKNRPVLARNILTTYDYGGKRRILLSIVGEKRLRKVLQKLLDEKEFLSPHGLRSLSKYHEEHPYVLDMEGGERSVRYEPAEAQVKLKGGNSNWRGPIWFPTSCMILDALLVYHRFIGDTIRFQFPAETGFPMSCGQIAHEIAARMVGIFVLGPDGARPCFGAVAEFRDDPHWKEYVQFFEYFNGDNGAGLGATHQTGWTGLVANVINHKYSYKL